MKELTRVVFVIMLIMLITSKLPAAIMDSVNAELDPITHGSWSWLVGGRPTMLHEVGWLYTPDSPYFLTGVKTKFGTGGRPEFIIGINLEVYDGLPVSGGTLLRSGGFGVPEYGVFVGSSFAPLELTAGEDYFIGFQNVFLPPRNATDGGVSLPCYGDTARGGTYSLSISDIGPGVAGAINPVLQFYGEPIPEPATGLLLGLGSLGLLRKLRGKK